VGMSGTTFVLELDELDDSELLELLSELDGDELDELLDVELLDHEWLDVLELLDSAIIQSVHHQRLRGLLPRPSRVPRFDESCRDFHLTSSTGSFGSSLSQGSSHSRGSFLLDTGVWPLAERKCLSSIEWFPFAGIRPKMIVQQLARVPGRRELKC